MNNEFYKEAREMIDAMSTEELRAWLESAGMIDTPASSAPGGEAGAVPVESIEVERADFEDWFTSRYSEPLQSRECSRQWSTWLARSAGVYKARGDWKISPKPWGPAESFPSAAPAAAPDSAQHPDDAAVDRFAAAMKAKMAASRTKGRGGWDDPTVCSAAALNDMLAGHLAKGDPVDVGNFAMMLWNRGERTTAPASAQQGEDEPKIPKPECLLPGVYAYRATHMQQYGDARAAHALRKLGDGVSDTPTDAEIVAALHACGIDTRPSKYGFDALQVDATSVPSLRNVFNKLAQARAAGAERAALEAQTAAIIGFAEAAAESHLVTDAKRFMNCAWGTVKAMREKAQIAAAPSPAAAKEGPIAGVPASPLSREHIEQQDSAQVAGKDGA